MDFLPQMRAYFLAQKNESLFSMLLGAATLTTAFFGWFVWKKPFYVGMAWPLAGVAVVQILVGAQAYFRTDKMIAFFETRFSANPTAFAAKARERVRAVLRRLTAQIWVKAALAAVGFALILIHVHADFWKGFGAGLFLQGGLMWLAEFFAKKRAVDYLKLLDELS